MPLYEFKIKSLISKESLIRYKVYWDRARMYYSYLSFPSMIIIVINSFGGFLSNMLHKYPIGFLIIGSIAFVVASLLIGHLDKKLGLFQAEAKRHSELNPISMEILKEVKEIKEILNNEL